MEDALLQPGLLAQGHGRASRRAVAQLPPGLSAASQRQQQPLQLVGAAQLIKADANAIFCLVQVEAGRQGSGHQHLGLIWRQRQPHRVKTLARQHRQSEGLQASHKGRPQAEQAPGDRLQAIGAMVHGIETGHHCQQHLGSADVAGGLVAADVLFAGLQGQAQGRLACRIH